MNALATLAAVAALVPAPREQTWRDGTCALSEKDVRFVRDAALPAEGYRLDIAPDGIAVASADDAGAFYAMKTLRQLGGKAKALPCGTVTDWPAFRWRGLMLDEGRHFFGKEDVLRDADRRRLRDAVEAAELKRRYNDRPRRTFHDAVGRDERWKQPSVSQQRLCP